MSAGEPKMTTAECVEEADWLLGGGVHPLLVAEALGRTMVALERACRVHGRKDIAPLFKVEWSDQTQEQRDRRNAQKRENKRSQKLAA